MEFDHLLISISEKVATVMIDRPEKGNSLSPDVLAEIEVVFAELSEDKDVNVVVLTGGEKMFSAGFDLDYIRTIDKVSNEAFTALFHRAYRAIQFCRQPVIAAVGGPAIAGGFDLTLMCDIRYASERAKFGQREVVLSLTPLLDPLWRIIGLGAAREIALTGRIFDAAEAFRLGYVSRVFPTGEVVESVTKIATEMASYDRDCLAETKQLSISVLDQSLETAMKTQEWLFRSYIGSQDNKARIEALQESLKKRAK
ncbi:MAG TPA: enoyl-CoA hydratase/isomerase family protein [Candidatus Anoxymicrobiaceae bacterium]|jgi:enoyl-CoA hydratase/carnithine racemase